MKYIEVVEPKDLKEKIEELGETIIEALKEVDNLVDLAGMKTPRIEVNVQCVDGVFAECRVVVWNKVAVSIRAKSRYTVAYIRWAPGKMLLQLEKLLFEEGFVRGEYGGYITRQQVNVRSIADKVAELIRQNIGEYVEDVRRAIKKARDLLLWVDNWDPDKSLEEDVLEKLPPIEVPEAVEAVEAEKFRGVGGRVVQAYIEAREAVESGEAEEASGDGEKQHLVKLYLLMMRLPSKYLVLSRDDSVSKAVASRLEGLRRTVYEKVAKHFVHIESCGVWISVDDASVTEATRITEWLRNELESMPALKKIKEVDITRYGLKVIPVYIDTREAKELLGEAIATLEHEIKKLEEKLETATKQSTRKKIGRQLEVKQKLLEKFKSHL